ncbi:hypothetical protein [Pseudomonas syringae]|jgi:hypothetical protein|uniref:hypothetical protein n=1 Tax=Pseudomonas syringae TaxID=317 RepID=UPI0002A7AD25|nr:hypothetical protein [Pseudomonas syringae]ELP97784.1 hypothetical protein A979_18910 [Pseudomonas syringae BRIP34876]ELQ01274.1 hypothetical protein A987_14927 [Pseudomonas syringae BRIP34881]OBS35664.1 hypothetical protein A9K81_06655 [Pseudomonas syringae pv. syringae]
MPLPIILWGAAAALAATGVFKGVEASGNFDKAKEIGENAEAKFKKTSQVLDGAREETQAALTALGKLKVHTFSHQIKYLVEAFKKRKDTKSTLKGFNEDFTVEQLKAYEKLVLNSLEIERGLASGVGGGALAAIGAYGSVGALASASTGAAISGLSGAAATNATLAWLGGGALSAGGFGMAGGMIALGGIVLGPALAIGGFMMASKAEEALTKAHAYQAKVETAVAEMEVLKTALKAIRTNAAEMAATITELVKRFEAIKVNDDCDSAAFERMVVLGTGLKKVLDVPIIAADGSAVKNIKGTISGILTLS